MDKIFVKLHNAFSFFMADLIDILEYFANLFASFFHYCEKHTPTLQALVKDKDFWYAVILIALAYITCL